LRMKVVGISRMLGIGQSEWKVQQIEVGPKALRGVRREISRVRVMASRD